MIYLASQMLNSTGWNLAGKCGYVWGGTAVVCWVMAYFFLPELKHRSYREADILFNRRIPARKFKTTVIDVVRYREVSVLKELPVLLGDNFFCSKAEGIEEVAGEIWEYRLAMK
jgi:hypothetical protein